MTPSLPPLRLAAAQACHDGDMPPLPLVWWTTDLEANIIYRSIEKEAWPEYLTGQLVSRSGRHARGRLWVDRVEMPGQYEIPKHHFPLKPLGIICADAGGILIHARDLRHVRGLPGFVTDLELNLVRAMSADLHSPRPIEEAPRDGTKLLLLTPRYGWLVGDFNVSFNEWRAYHHCGAALLNGAMDGPTHFMPMPATGVPE